MPPRRQSAPKQESKTGLVIALVIFILLTITLGAMTYVGFDGQKELESKASTATKERDDARKEADIARAQLMANRIMMGTADKAPTGEDLGRLNSNDAFRAELQQIIKSFAPFGVNWDPKTDQPPESALVALKKYQQERDTEKSNTAAALQERDKRKADYESKEAAETAATTQAKAEQVKAATTAANAQKETQDAKNFAINDINKLKAQLKDTQTKNADEVAGLQTQNKRLAEDVTGKAEALKKHERTLDAQRAKILLTDIRHGEVTRVDTTSDTAFINLGSSDYVRPGMSFSVLQDFDKSRMGPEDPLPKKASLAVVRVLGPKTSQCTIKYSDDVNSTKDPVRSGDGLYKPGWKPGTPVRWALAGHFDLNGLGRDETKILVERLRKEGIVVDAYLDLNTLKVVGDLNYGIDYLIVGNRPTGETARIIGEERKEQIEKAINDMVGKSQTMGIAVMQHRVFLPIAGIDLPRQQALPYFPGGTAGPGGDKPAEDKPKEEKKDKDEGK
jgi:hypothetical protein